MSERVAFCPRCGQPTRHATDADRLDFDLKQWRSHIERTATADGGNGKPKHSAAPRAGVATAIREEPHVRPTPVEKKRRFSLPSIRIPKVKLPRRAPRVIELDEEDRFAYRECPWCGELDWILRGSRNDDGTFNYWCLRCSRAFKTTVRLAHGRKPFIAAGTVVAVLIAFMYLLR